MTQDDIVVMAVNAGLVKWEVLAYKNELERFAKLVAAKEREACADMVFRYIAQTANMEARGCLASVTHDIRARGEA